MNGEKDGLRLFSTEDRTLENVLFTFQFEGTVFKLYCYLKLYSTVVSSV